MIEFVPVQLSEVFTWTDVDGKETNFYIPALRMWCEATQKPIEFEFPLWFRDQMKVINDVNAERAMALPPEELLAPSIVLFSPDGPDRYWCVVVDGSHRVWRLLGERTTVPIYAVPWSIAERDFQLTTDHDILGWLPLKDAKGQPYDPVVHHKAALAMFKDEDKQDG